MEFPPDTLSVITPKLASGTLPPFKAAFASTLYARWVPFDPTEPTRAIRSFFTCLSSVTFQLHSCIGFQFAVYDRPVTDPPACVEKSTFAGGAKGENRSGSV